MKTKFNIEKFIIYILIPILIILYILECNKNNKNLDLLQRTYQNNKALMDSVRASKNISGEIQYEKNSYILEIKELKEINKELYDEIKKQRGQVSNLTKIVSTIDFAPKEIKNNTYITNNKFNGLNIKTDWAIDTSFSQNNFRKLKGFNIIDLDSLGKIKNSQTIIQEDKIGFDIITGIEKKNGFYEIFVRSNYPGFKPTKIDGNIIPEKNFKNNRWRPGISVSTGFGFGWNGKSVTPVPYIGVGIGLNKNLK